jgi:hypothetical protein
MNAGLFRPRRLAACSLHFRAEKANNVFDLQDTHLTNPLFGVLRRHYDITNYDWRLWVNGSSPLEKGIHVTEFVRRMTLNTCSQAQRIIIRCQ